MIQFFSDNIIKFRMLVARFFVGVGSSTFATLVGGIIADIYHSKIRNVPMCIFGYFIIWSWSWPGNR